MFIAPTTVASRRTFSQERSARALLVMHCAKRIRVAPVSLTRTARVSPHCTPRWSPTVIHVRTACTSRRPIIPGSALACRPTFVSANRASAHQLSFISRVKAAEGEGWMNEMPLRPPLSRSVRVFFSHLSILPGARGGLDLRTPGCASLQARIDPLRRNATPGTS